MELLHQAAEIVIKAQAVVVVVEEVVVAFPMRTHSKQD